MNGMGKKGQPNNAGLSPTKPKPSVMLKHNAGLASECTGVALRPNCHQIL